MSLINREDLIAEYDRVHVGPPGGARKLMEDAPEVKPEPHWIPCSERLPEDKTAYYLVTLGKFGDFYVYHEEEIDIARWDRDHRKGKDSWHWCKERTVTAWMPLPEPYREEGD